MNKQDIQRKALMPTTPVASKASNTIDARKHPPGSVVEVRTLADGQVLVVVKKRQEPKSSLDIDAIHRQ